MNLLLDTHVVLWWLGDPPKLPAKFRRALEDERNLVFLSAVSVWEISIKQQIGKIELPDSFYTVLWNEAFEHLSVTTEHARYVSQLPLHHRDPFDRLLIAQCLLEDLTLVTVDSQILRYGVKTL